MTFRSLFCARAQIVLGVALTLSMVVLWPATALTVFRHEPQGVLGLSYGAMILAGYGLIATGLGYRATERVEEHVKNHVGPSE